MGLFRRKPKRDLGFIRDLGRIKVADPDTTYFVREIAEGNEITIVPAILVERIVLKSGTPVRITFDGRIAELRIEGDYNGIQTPGPKTKT